MKDFPKYLEARAARLKNLYIFLNTEATVDKIKQFKPDIIVNSTGSVPLVPPIKGLKENIDAGNVNTIFGMINNVNAENIRKKPVRQESRCSRRRFRRT